MAALAVNSSLPVGIGVLHFDHSRKSKACEFEIKEGMLHLDYVGGRMVKFHALKRGDTLWEVNDLIDEYQSWAAVYPTWSDLIKNVSK